MLCHGCPSFCKLIVGHLIFIDTAKSQYPLQHYTLLFSKVRLISFSGAAHFGFEGHPMQIVNQLQKVV